MIKLKDTPEQRELVQALGSKKPEVSRPAMEAFAAAIGPVIQRVLEQAATASLIFVDQPFDEDESPSYPLDLFYNEQAGYVTVWSQQIAGGLASSSIEGVKELKISTYRLDSAVNFLKKYARKNNLNVLSKAVERMLQEVLVKQERMAWSVLTLALAQASTPVPIGQSSFTHTIPTGTAGVLLLDDFNNLIVRVKRINSSFAGGTTTAPYSRGPTDLFVSPEVKAQIRGFAYNPMNTRQATSGVTSIPLPDAIREEIYRGSGVD